jgi:hypothetical protein
MKLATANNTNNLCVPAAKPKSAPLKEPMSDEQHDRLVKTGLATVAGALVGGLASLGCSAMEIPQAPNLAVGFGGLMGGIMAGGFGGLELGQKVLRNPYSSRNEGAVKAIMGTTAVLGAAGGMMGLGALSSHLSMVTNALVSATVGGAIAAVLSYDGPAN